MREQTIETRVFGVHARLTGLFYEESDRLLWKEIFDARKKLNVGLKSFQSRGANLPEGISETAFCLATGYIRYTDVISLESNVNLTKSFDTFDIVEQMAHQVKATSVSQDLTSFGPRSQWDILYFLDFYRDGALDGSFDIYEIPNDLIYNMQVNTNQTLRQQQIENRRPRFSIKANIIDVHKLEPWMANVKVWL